MRALLFLLPLVLITGDTSWSADDPVKPVAPQLAALNAYFEQQVSSLEGQLERDIKTKEDWLAKKDEYRRQLAEMLGLDPMPPRTDLKATVTGTFEHEGIIVENLHFQASPGLYVTANFYKPKAISQPLPTILYVCGHGAAVKDGVSYGNKTHYEHHGVWYAKHGFCCLVIDTVELGEIRGEHHGTYSKGRFWWWSRGYTPAGCEAWQGIRALDYLETRPEVDKTRFGVTGRSGGGAYSWWIAALDERIKCAAPTAGITTLRNHVVDGCVEGHCDCMFMVNTYRWDYDKVAALVAPRALCIVNTDKDGIFPIDGVFKIYQSVRRIYKLLDAEKNIGLQIAEGPHQDSQPLNVGEFHWMTRFLQGAEPMSTLDSPAVHSIPMEKLQVFGKADLQSALSREPVVRDGRAASPPNSADGTSALPKDEKNTTIDESLVPIVSTVKVPQSKEEWGIMRDKGMKAAKEKVLGPVAPSSTAELVSSNQDASEGLPTGSVAFVSFRGARWVVRGNQCQLTRTSEGTEASLLGVTFEPDHQQESGGVGMTKTRVLKEDGTIMEVYLSHRAGLKLEDLELLVINVLDEQGWKEFTDTYALEFPDFFSKAAAMAAPPEGKAFEQEKKMFQNFKWGMAYVCPRGIGPTAWDESSKGIQPLQDKKGEGQGLNALATKAAAAAEKSRVQRLRRFYLLGQTLEGQQVWDVRCAIRALRSIEGLKDTKLWLQASRTQAANALMASLFEDNISRLDLHELPHSLMPTKKDKEGHPINDGEPVYLNMLKYLDLPQAAAMAAERTRLVIYDDDKAAWKYPQDVSEKLGWGKDKKNGLQLRDVPKADK